LAKSDCTSLSHSCIDMKKNEEEWLTKLAEAIEKRREVQNYLPQVSKALKMLTAEVDGLKEVNNIFLAELVSLLEGQTLQSAEEQELGFIVFVSTQQDPWCDHLKL